MTTVTLSPEARSELYQIIDYLRLNSGNHIARKHEQAFKELFTRLQATPHHRR